MKIKKWLAMFSVVAAFSPATAQQGGGYTIVAMPIGTVSPDSVALIQWIGPSRNPAVAWLLAPDSGYIYYSRSPGGGKLANYANRVTKPWIDSLSNKHDNMFIPPSAASPVPRRQTQFKPGDQTDMGAGVFYCVVALPLAADTLVSNEFQIFVESPNVVEREAPKGTITDLTPTFSWKANPGVPYYHVILSDEPITWNTANGTVDLKGLSIVWQAITPANQIVYGVPDPSQTLTADPPPLSPGTSYTWIVLNNYANQPAFSSYRSAQYPPGEFKVAGTGLKPPVDLYPVRGSTLNATQNKKFSFKWTNLDPAANTYKIYVYVGADFAGFEGVEAKMVVWQSEVRASNADTMSVEIDAASVLTSNKYVWRVMAVDAKGAATAGDTSSFKYSAPVGTMCIYTRENVISARGDTLDTVVTDVGLVQIKTEVLDGSMEAPLLFYTDTRGNLVRDRPTGSYRVTTVKDGFEDLSKTIVLGESDTTRDTFFLVRPESRIYGRIVDESGKGINLATAQAVSDRKDTVTVKSDGLGNFVINCYGADWIVAFSMAGYKPALPSKITVKPGESYNFGTVTMQRNPYTLSGVVKNDSLQPVTGATVSLLRNGVLIDQIPSTPQSGVFSFTVPAGTYQLTAERAGFANCNQAVDLAGSMNLVLTMQPGATLISGFVYRSSWVAERQVFSPIPAANIWFVKVGAADTVRGSFDPQYGNYTANVAPKQRYAVYSSAAGFAPKNHADTITVNREPNFAFNDTLQEFAMLTGRTRLSSSGRNVGGVSVSLVNIISKTVGATAQSQVDGYLQLLGIPDGRYTVQAGASGMELDSIMGPDTVGVSAGRSTVTALNVFMKYGAKTVKWAVKGGQTVSAAVKIQSPLVKTLQLGDSIVKAGAGAYIIACDAGPDSIIDLSYHRFVVPDSLPYYTDSVSLDVVHRRADSMTPAGQQVTLAIQAGDTLDSAVIYFKDAEGSAWLTARNSGRAAQYSFSVMPPHDGSMLEYYFKAYRKGDVYGYDQETYYTYVRPDTVLLTRIEIAPASTDTLRFPAGCGVQFFFRGYYSSSFIRAARIDSLGVTWRLSNAQGCVLEKSRGLSTTVRTASSRLSSPATLSVDIDNGRIQLKSGVSPTVAVKFLVSGSPLARIRVRRVDAQAGQPISTSLADRAEFIAEGIDTQKSVLNLSPVWGISPESAGTISPDGTFRPAGSFIGFVRVRASVGNVWGEYIDSALVSQGALEPGLKVLHLIGSKSAADTATNGNDFSVVFPPQAVSGTNVGMLELSIPNVRNRMKQGFLNMRMVDSNAYDINERQGISFNLVRDSIRLVLSIPGGFQKDAASKKRPFWIACWNEDSLRWNALANSVVAADGKTISAGIVHFSQYAVVSQPGQLSAEFSISPNPFSPRVRPLGAGQPFGACISVKPEMPEVSLQFMEIRIYNLVGDMVWAVQIRNALPEQYSVWWDGTTTERVENWADRNVKTVQVKGKNMCRNGRYFVVLIIKDMNNKELKYMKPVILMK